MTWILFPLLAALLWASVNHMDKYLISKYCKNREIGGLLIFSGFIALPVLIILSIWDTSLLTNIPMPATLYIVLSGVCYMLGIIPYLYALQDDEASTIAPQMIMVAIFTSLLGFFFLGENLNLFQWIGAVLIILGTLLISLDIKNLVRPKLKFKILGLMVISTLLISINVFLFKFVAIDIGFVPTVFWLHVGYLLITVLIFIFIKQYRQQFYSLVSTNRTGIIAINVISEVITLAGNMFFHYSTLLIPLVLAEVLTEGTQPFFVLFIGIMIARLFPSLSEDRLDPKTIFQKLLSIIVMVVGILLLNLS